MDWFGIQHRQQERQAERLHQQELLKTFLRSLELIQETAAKESGENAKALIEVAKSVTAQAESFGEWLKCFQPTSAPTTSVVRDEDEYVEEQLERMNQGLSADVSVLPPELQLAYALHHDPTLGEK